MRLTGSSHFFIWSRIFHRATPAPRSKAQTVIETCPLVEPKNDLLEGAATNLAMGFCTCMLISFNAHCKSSARLAC